MERELACHPNVTGSNLVRAFSLVVWPQVLHLQLPRSVITPYDEKNEEKQLRIVEAGEHD